jgi:hypothetical protein
VVVVLFRPADEQGAVAVHPGVTRFDDPAPSAPAGGVGLEADLVAAAADVRRKPALGGELVHRGRVVGAVETEPLRRLRRRLGPPDRDAV